jgi:hypothetical protein
MILIKFLNVAVMPKQPNQPSGRSKIRLLYIDGDLSSGDLRDITQAIAGTLRPVPIIAKAQIASRNAADENSADDKQASGELEEVQETDASENVNEQPETPREPAKPRKYRSPKVVNDLNMKSGGKPFAEFAVEKGNPSEHMTRYLIATYWLEEHAKISPATVDHVYTCYKAANWSFDVVDPTKAFRNLKSNGDGEVKDGKFTINHLGKDRVEKMKKVNGD